MREFGLPCAREDQSPVPRAVAAMDVVFRNCRRLGEEKEVVMTGSLAFPPQPALTQVKV